MGKAEGSIIAIIIASHMSAKALAASSHVCPGMRIHIIDIVQLPGICMPWPDIERSERSVKPSARTNAAVAAT